MLKAVVIYIGLLLLTAAVITLPLLEMQGYLVDEPMTWGEAIVWWVIFGGGIVYIWKKKLTSG